MTPTALVTAPPRWLDSVEYPFQSRTFSHRDGMLHYVDEGRGSPLLFVHGTPSWSFEWRAAIRHCKPRYRCLALDHLGFGLSDKPQTGSYLPQDHTRRLHDFICARELYDITLVVHDFGGPIATPLLVRDPSRFRRVVAVNTWAWPTDTDPRGQRLSRFIRSPLGRFVYLWCNASPRWLVPASFARKQRLARAIHRHYLAPFPTRYERVAPWTLGCHLTNTSAYAPELPHVLDTLRHLPLAVIWGGEDRLLGAEPLSRWRREFPEAHVYELRDSGHFPQEETPEAFLTALEQVLS